MNEFSLTGINGIILLSCTKFMTKKNTSCHMNKVPAKGTKQGFGSGQLVSQISG